MITAHPCRDEEYYVTETIEGRTEYLSEGGRAASQWAGSLGAELGLSGIAPRNQLTDLFSGQLPSGEPLTATNIKNVGFDITLSPPKSISLIWALGSDHDAEQVEAAMYAARNDVERYLEDVACSVRRGKAGARIEPATGFLGAVFTHKTSRHGDPGLHLHWVVFNAGEGPDGRRTALDGRQLYAHRYTAEAIFEAALRRELTTRLGLRFEDVDEHGAAEVTGIDEHIRMAFSQRRVEILAEMDRLGVHSGDAARIATLTTRKPKATGITEADLRAEWHQRANRLGFSVDQVPRDTTIEPPTLDVSDTDLADDLTDQHATFSRQAAVRAVARRAARGATLDDILERTERYLASEYAVQLADGIWSTPEILELERAILDIAAGPASHRRCAEPDHVADAVAERQSIGAEQRRMVESLCGDGRPVSTVVGEAGTGKTFTLDAVRDAFQRSGHRVIGACLSAAAARELSDGAAITSWTAERLTRRVVSGKNRFRPDDVLVIDEAAMMGTKQLAFLVRMANDAGAKVILVGDHKQLPAIGAGGIFATLVRQPGTVTLTENRRQQDPAERAVVADLRSRRSRDAIEGLDRIGHITTADNADALRDQMTLDWYAHHQAGGDTLMGALRRSDARDLNNRAHALLAADGQLGPTVLAIDDQQFSVGDRMLATKNAYELGILNGDLGTISGMVDGQLRVETDKGLVLDLPLDYVTEHIQHGYARTVHKSQGLTCDVALLLGGDDLYAEVGYTGLTRGRQENHLYTVAVDHDSPLDDLIQSLATSRAKQSAHDVAPTQTRDGVRRLLDLAGPHLKVG